MSKSFLVHVVGHYEHVFKIILSAPVSSQRYRVGHSKHLSESEGGYHDSMKLSGGWRHAAHSATPSAAGARGAPQRLSAKGRLSPEGAEEHELARRKRQLEDERKLALRD